MKKNIMALSLLSTLTLTGNAYAKAGDSYTEIGVASIELEVENKFTAENYTFFTIGGGYNITDNVAIQLTGYVPMSAETQGTQIDLYRLPVEGNENYNDWTEAGFQDVTGTNYDTTFESKGMITAEFKLTLPIHERFSAFAKVGYTYGSFKHISYSFEDHVPITTITPESSACEITGNEEICGNANFADSIKNTREESSFSYGAGFALHLVNNSSFIFSYNKYLDKDDLNAQGFQANYQWKF
jgi:opacity protein-like surface antigen